VQFVIMVNPADEPFEPSIGECITEVCTIHMLPLTRARKDGQEVFVCLVCQEMGIDGGVTYAPIPVFDPNHLFD
jgi:hypothetical protein